MKPITALENVQRRATKLLPGYKELDYKERLKRLNLPTLAYRRLRGDMIEMYTIFTGKYDSTVTSNCITLRENDSITRGHNLKKNYQRKIPIEHPKKNHLYTDLPSVQSFEVKIDQLWTNHPKKLFYCYYGLYHL